MSEKVNAIKIDCVADNIDLECWVPFFQIFRCAANSHLFWLCTQQKKLNFKEFLPNIWQLMYCTVQCAARKTCTLLVSTGVEFPNFLVEGEEKLNKNDVCERNEREPFWNSINHVMWSGIMSYTTPLHTCHTYIPHPVIQPNEKLHHINTPSAQTP
jgi:hypothetical protein